MIEIRTFLTAQGAGFSPAKVRAELGVDLGSGAHEPGALATKGRYRGRPFPYGSLVLDVDLTVEESGGAEGGSEADLLSPNLVGRFRRSELIPALRRHGATEVQLWVNVAYREQCNLELSPLLLAELANLGVHVLVSCFEVEDPCEGASDEGASGRE